MRRRLTILVMILLADSTGRPNARFCPPGPLDFVPLAELGATNKTLETIL